jgi:DNA-binding HxlR family transcriptional regulator
MPEEEADVNFDRPGDVFLADCPARLALDIIADKWSLVTLYAVSRGPRRHGELVELIGGISSKVLTDTLRKLERHGLVSRRDYVEVPRRVEYDLTELGRTLIEPIGTLTSWAEANGERVLAALDAAEAQAARTG